jgi:hypothetical protein
MARVDAVAVSSADRPGSPGAGVDPRPTRERNPRRGKAFPPSAGPAGFVRRRGPPRRPAQASAIGVLLGLPGPRASAPSRKSPSSPPGPVPRTHVDGIPLPASGPTTSPGRAGTPRMRISPIESESSIWPVVGLGSSGTTSLGTPWGRSARRASGHLGFARRDVPGFVRGSSPGSPIASSLGSFGARVPPSDSRSSNHPSRGRSPAPCPRT